MLLIALILTGTTAAQEDYQDPAALADEDGQFVTLNGYNVYYLDRGPKDGPPVVLLHGFLGSVIDWTNTFPALTEAGYRVIAYDRPPFGLSDKRTELNYSLQAMTDLTAGLMDELGIASAVVIGHSAGGSVAADFAVRYPERVEKLVLIAGAVGITGPSAEGGNPFAFLGNIDPDSPLAQNLIRTFFTGDFGQDMLNRAVSDPAAIDAELLAKRERGLKVKGWEGGLLAFVRDSLLPESQFDLEQLREVTFPVLLIWGEGDQIVPIEVGENLAELFPNDTWITYPNVGHLPMDEATEQLNADLLEFLGA
jgi:pimeloyl-ACP methyl ester carboxylesterase